VIAMALANRPTCSSRRADDRARRHRPGADPRAAQGLQAKLAWRCCFITHDLGIVRKIANDVA